MSRLEALMEPHDLAISTRLPEMLAQYQQQLATARMPLFLLAAQAFVFALYTLAMLASFSLERSQGEVVTLIGRGAGKLETTLIFAVEYVALMVPAAVLFGPLLARGAVNLWLATQGVTASWAIPAESRLLALLAGGLGWLALVVPVHLSTSLDLLEWQRQTARPARGAVWQRLYLDLILLILGAVIYWQLTESGTLLTRGARNGWLADPILMLGPSLMLIAVALVFLRVFPYVLRLAAWGTQGARGLVLPLGLARMARAPRGPSRVILLISLAVGLIFFANAFSNSLAMRQLQMAHYLAGADLRLSMAEESLDAAADLPGVRTAAPVFRTSVRTAEQRPMQMLAVDPGTFQRVARYPPAFTNLTMASLLRTLGSKTDPAVLPAIVSQAALPASWSEGEQLEVYLSGRPLVLEVRGRVINFPTVSGAFVVVSLPELRQLIDLAPLERTSSWEAWLSVLPDQQGVLAADPRLGADILDDAHAQLDRLRADALATGAVRAFQLNALTLSILSVAAFVLVHYFAARQRTHEFSILRAAGSTPRQLLALLVSEGILVLVLGLLAGTCIGYALSRFMVVYLSPVLSSATAGAAIREIYVDFPAVFRLDAFLVSAFLLAMIVLLVALLRVGVHRALRMGEE
jgi:hypothetical protein